MENTTFFIKTMVYRGLRDYYPLLVQLSLHLSLSSHLLKGET